MLFSKKIVICCKKCFFIHLCTDGWQLKFFGNATRYCLEEHFIVCNFLCSNFFDDLAKMVEINGLCLNCERHFLHSISIKFYFFKSWEISRMIRLVCCSSFFSLMFYMKLNSPQVFYNGTSGCLESLDKITNMIETIERTCADFIGIQKDSVVIVCFDGVEHQIRLTDRKRFINSLLELECFNFKIKSLVLCVDALREKIISANKMCWGCMSMFCRVILSNDFHTICLKLNPYMK